MREAVQRLWPEIEWIGDATLREAVIATWAKAFEMSPLTPAGRRQRLKESVHGLEKLGSIDELMDLLTADG